MQAGTPCRTPPLRGHLQVTTSPRCQGYVQYEVPQEYPCRYIQLLCTAMTRSLHTVCVTDSRVPAADDKLITWQYVDTYIE
jgi:hypothetical protein